MKKYITSILCIGGLLFSAQTFAQVPANVPQLLTGKKIAIDPGHGGHDSDDRETPLGNGFTYYESDGVWEMGLILQDILDEVGANTKLTKTNNSITAPDRDPSLSERVAVANAFDADYMHSIHTNAGGGSANYTLLLYRGINSTPSWPDAKVMGGIMTQRLKDYMYTTDAYNRADRDFLPYYLGVLSGTQMPATLSEGSFHDNLPEGKRLMSSMYRRAAAWAMAKSFFEFYNTGQLPYGEVGGLLRDNSGTPINAVTCTINPGTSDARTVTVDNADNGYYIFDWLDAGNYTIEFSKSGYATTIQNVTVTSGGYTQTDVTMIDLGDPPARPTLAFVGNPNGGTSVEARWSLTSGATGYRLYYAENDNLTSWKLAADENTLTSSSTQVTLNSAADFVDVPSSDVYHFRLVATSVGTGGVILESETSDVYSRSSNTSGDAVLIVDGFDRNTGSYTGATHSFVTGYFKSLRDSKSVVVESTDNSKVADGTVVLTDYEAVVWFVGDESTNAETFATAEQTKVQAYLEAGGKLFVSGSEVGWDLWEKGTSTDQAFYTNYLKAAYQSDGAGNYSPATGVSGTAFAGVSVPFGITYTEDYADDIDPVSGATSILTYAEAGKAGGVAYTGTFGGGTQSGAVVYVSFPAETAALSDQTTLMGKVLDYFNVSAVNVAPIANNDQASTTQDVAISINVLSNDTDSNIDASTLTIVANASNGTAVVNNGQVDYTPSSGYIGSDSFTYQVSDTEGLVSNVATVNIDVLELLNCAGEGTEINPDKPKRDFRASWISTVANIDWPSSPNLSVAAQQAELIGLIDGLKESGVNAILFQVRPECDALYASTIDPWSYYLTGQQGQAPSPFYDPLTFAIDEAHKRGMELHAWLNPYRAQQGTPSLSSSHVASQHPDWVMDFTERDILNPGIPAVRDYVVSVINDIASRYDVDGIHFDDYFYPYSGMGSQDASAFASYNPNSLSLADWRRDNVNKLVEMVFDEIQLVNQAQNKSIKFGISPFGIWKSGVPSGISGMSAYDVIYADALAWLSAGTVDYISPQLYWDFGGGQDYAALSTWWDDQAAAAGKLHYPGLGLYRLVDSGSWPASTIQSMIDENRLAKNEATKGQIFFTTNNLTDNDKGIKTALQGDQYQYPSVVPTMSWKESVCPNVPSNFRYEGGDLVWDAPSAASDGDLAERYAVYRFSSLAELTTNLHDGTKLVAVTGETSVGVASAWLTGTDNYFVVSALDKNSNESGFTASVNIAGNVQYCAAQGNNTTYEWIAGVAIGAITKSSGSDGGYADKTAESFPLTIGNTYSLTLTPGYASTAYNENWKVWIDFNEDGDFDDTDELVYAIGSVAKNAVSGSLTIPAGVSAGNKRMRVGMNGSSSDYTLNSCGSFAYGEVEDYTVSLTAPTPVAPVANNDSESVQSAVAVALAVLANDTDTNGDIDVSTVTIVSAVSNGFTSVNASTGVITYTSNVGFTGTDSFTYTVQDQSGLTSNTATVTISVTDLPPAPCASSNHNATYEWIDNVTFGAFSNTSGSDGGYGDYTSQTISGVSTGGQYSISLKPGFQSTAYQEHWKVWIDFNADGDFDDAGEELFDTYGTGTAAVTGSITIPFDVTSGTKTMRVGMNGTSADYTLTPCNAFTYGEVEDYYIFINNTGCTPPAVTSMVIDNNDTGYSETGTWISSTSTAGYIGSGYRHEGDANKGNASVTYAPDITVDGTYEVFIFYTAGSNRATNAPVDINHANGTTQVIVNQQNNNTTWVSLGTYSFLAGSGNAVLKNDGTDGVVIADAMRFDFVNCNVASSRKSIEDGVAGLESPVLYPNPVVDRAQVKFNSEVEGEVTILLYAQTGELVGETVEQGIKGLNVLNIPTAQLSTGVYIVQVIEADGKTSYLRMLKN